MKKSDLLVLVICFNIVFTSYGQKVDSVRLRMDKIEQSLTYQIGLIPLDQGNAELLVPKGFRYLDKEQSLYVLTELWGNPADSSILGMLVLEKRGVLESNSWVFAISYNEMGYVKDNDAEDIDYDELLKQQQAEFIAANPDRIKQGFQPIEFIGWATKPYYDKNKKILHWAKALRFGKDSLNTLNYNLRILGRKGIFMLNAVATISELEEVKVNIDKVISSIEFKEGHQYADFKPEVDNVAAWTIGSLVAGKILAKVGFFPLLAKFGKLIVLALIGLCTFAWAFFKSRINRKNSIAEHSDGIEHTEED